MIDANEVQEMIERFRVQNYKALRDVELKLTPIHVLIGPNDSGKTSILEALAALSRSVDMPWNEAFEGSWNGRELVWQSADAPITLEASLTNSVTYGAQLVFGTNGRNVKTDREWINTYETLLYRGSHASLIWGISQNQSPNLEAATRAVAKSIHTNISGVHVYRWIPRMLGLPCAADPARRFRMIGEGFGLALVLDEILGFDRQRFEHLEDQFKAIFRQVKSVKLQQSKAYRVQRDPSQDFPVLIPADGKGLYFEMAGGGGLIPASEISDGLLLVLAYLTILNLPEPPRLLLIEEPENGVHPQRLRDVLKILRDIAQRQQDTQIILTTHSPYVVDLFKPEEVTLCQKADDGSVQVTRLSDSPMVLKQKDIFTLGEIWTSEGDEALSKQAVGSK